MATSGKCVEQWDLKSLSVSVTRRTIENKEDPAKLALSPSAEQWTWKKERKLCITNPHARLVSTEWHRTNIHSKTDLETTTREEKKRL